MDVSAVLRCVLESTHFKKGNWLAEYDINANTY